MHRDLPVTNAQELSLSLEKRTHSLSPFEITLALECMLAIP